MSSPIMPDNQPRMVGSREGRKEFRRVIGISSLDALVAADAYMSGLPHIEDDLVNTAALDVLYAAGVRLEAMIDDCLPAEYSTYEW